MDLEHPTRAVTSTLDGPVLEVLVRTTEPLTGSEVHRLTGTGSANGIRLALARLVSQGLVEAKQRGNAIFYKANRDHLAWPAVEALVALRRSLIERLVEELGTWQDDAHYGLLHVSGRRVTDALRQAGRLVNTADELVAGS